MLEKQAPIRGRGQSGQADRINLFSKRGRNKFSTDVFQCEIDRGAGAASRGDISVGYQRVDKSRWEAARKRGEHPPAAPVTNIAGSGDACTQNGPKDISIRLAARLMHSNLASIDRDPSMPFTARTRVHTFAARIPRAIIDTRD